MPTICCSWDRWINKCATTVQIRQSRDGQRDWMGVERQPSNQTFAWPNARMHCAQKAVGERGGSTNHSIFWRFNKQYSLRTVSPRRSR